MITKRNITIIVIIITTLIIILGFLSHHFYFRDLLSSKTQKEICANDRFDIQYSKGIEDGLISISVKDKNTGKELSNFSVSDVYEGHYHFIEIHNCFIYLIKQFGFDYQKGVFDTNYRRELWRYNLNGAGEKIFPPSAGRVQGIDFRVNRDGTCVVIQSSVSLIDEIRFIDLVTGKETYYFNINDLINQGLIDRQLSVASMGPVSVGQGDWTKDNRYFWGKISVGAYVFNFFRVDTADWNLEIFEAPEGVLGGSALNIEKGYVTQCPGNVWTGIDILTEQIKKEWQEQGKISSLYLYNLFTKEQTLLATTEEPVWSFNPKWLSDTELEYYLPSGERKVYTIDNTK